MTPRESAAEGLLRSQRITDSQTFQETYDQGKRFHGKFMVLWLREGDDASMRLGVVASRKVGNAVMRARAKRRMREAFRRHRKQFHGNSDVVLVARRALVKASWKDLLDELLMLARKAGLLPQ